VPIALTVFGVTKDGLVPALSYVLLRTVRGPGEYPAATLPHDVSVDGVRHTALPDSPLTIITWDKVVPETDARALLADLELGRLMVPNDSPIAGGQTITGFPFGPLIAEEGFQIARISGIGLLYRKGIASDGPYKALREDLEKNLGVGTVPRVLRSLVARIGELSGIPEIFTHRRPVGIVDYFYRTAVTEGVDGPLFDVAAGEFESRTKAPMVQVLVRRHAAPIDRKFTIQITLGNYDEGLSSQLLEIDAGVRDIVASAPAHITDVSLLVFDDAGNLADRLKGQFRQGFHFGVTAVGAVDTLPPPFPGSPESADLEMRPRLATVAFEGPAIANRSGGLDVLRAQEAKLSAAIGPRSMELESIWFDRGMESQVEVIRWIKKKIEQPGVRKAYLVDPFLGSAALKRVVARQGNETVEVFIVISPGNIDPDADTAETPASNDYLAKLISTASEWAGRLAGRISIVHVKRANGSRQAFHDRYLCVVDQKGIPTAYLLSNSLSKAAGDWPFAISELDRVMSWRVYAYIQELILCQAVDSGLQSALIWKSADAADAVQPTPPAPPSAPQPSWTAWANAFLGDVRNIVFRNSEFKSLVSVRIDSFLAAWPEGVDVDKLAEALFDAVSHRNAVVVFLSDRLRKSGRPEVADILDDKLLARFLELLPGLEYKGGWSVPFDTRRPVLGHLGAIISSKQNATNFVRAKVNPKVYELVTMIETQRLDPSRAWDLHEAAMFLSIMALKAAIGAEGSRQQLRIGVATDYIHWLGRLMRSDVAAGVYVSQDPVPPEYIEDLRFAALQVAVARLVLGEALEAPIRRVNDDPWVAPVFKSTITSLRTDQGAVSRSS